MQSAPPTRHKPARFPPMPWRVARVWVRLSWWQVAFTARTARLARTTPQRTSTALSASTLMAIALDDLRMGSTRRPTVVTAAMVTAVTVTAVTRTAVKAARALS